MPNFIHTRRRQGLQAAADVAVVVDDLDPSDEAMNLMARHNIPFKVSLPTNLQSEDMEGVDVVVVFAKPDKELAIQLEHLASQGKTVVVVDAHGSYPWQSQSAVQLNEHAVSYAVGSGKVLELSEPVSDPETFAQDIRRLIGNQNAMMTLWNGFTTIAVPYQEKARWPETAGADQLRARSGSRPSQGEGIVHCDSLRKPRTRVLQVSCSNPA